MSLALKNPETSSPGLLDRLHVGILAGVVYVLAGLAIVCALLPWLWWNVAHVPRTPLFAAVLVLVGLGLAAGFVYAGLVGLSRYAVPGVKAGIFTALVTLLLIVLLTRGASSFFEGFVYDSRSMPETLGVILTAAVGVVLLALAGRFIFLAPNFGPKMMAFEEQGWFSTTSFKRSQGQRVRRGTIVGVLALVGCGIYAMVAHATLAGTTDWAVNIPFTGTETVTALNDAVVVAPDVKPGDEIKLGAFKEMNHSLKEGYQKLDEDVEVETETTTRKGQKGDVITKAKYDDLRKALAKENRKDPLTKPLEPATGIQKYVGLVLLPDVKYSLPFVLAALAIWFAWRVVNVPSFADFLIATEAELNKVSWTTRRRLIQDTIVVLATVVLFTIFLFVVDVAWGQILSLKAVGVLKLPEKGPGSQTPDQKW